MSSQHLSDEQLADGLRAYLPVAAPNGSAERMAVAIDGLPQRRRMRFPVAVITDVDPIGRRRSILVAAAFVLVAVLLGAAVAGAWLVARPRLPDLSVEPPRDLQAYMASVGDGPIARPMAFTVQSDRVFMDGEVIDRTVKTRILMDAAGSVRIERFASLDASEPESYSVFTRDHRVDVTKQGSEAVWVEEQLSGGGEPRSWIGFETITGVGPPERGCDMALDETGAAWTYVGPEIVLGRPVHHVRCGGDLWIDVETRLVLRSHGPLTDDGQPSDESTRTLEVTELALGDQPATLFDQAKPPGMRSVTPTDQEAYEDRIALGRRCAADPVCSAPEQPIVTPPPVATPDTPVDLEALVAATTGAWQDARPLQVTLSRWRTKGGMTGAVRLFYDGPTRFRVERDADPRAGVPANIGISDGNGHEYETEVAVDGSTAWSPVGRRWTWLDDSLLVLYDTCGDAPWRHLGVDQVGSFTADHVACPDGRELWIDRGTHLVVRRQSTPDELHGIEVVEVTDLRFVTSPDEQYRLPDDPVMKVQPTPDPDATETPGPQPAPAAS